MVVPCLVRVGEPDEMYDDAKKAAMRSPVPATVRRQQHNPSPAATVRLDARRAHRGERCK
jgi:hypothetical protein